MAKEKILIKKMGQLNKLKLELVSRTERTKDEVVDDIKETIDELEMILEDFDYINPEEKVDVTSAERKYRDLPEFNLSNLQQYNGLGGTPPYVAIEDEVYDISETEYWKNKDAYNASAGKNITRTFRYHQAKQSAIFEGSKLVGTLTSE